MGDRQGGEGWRVNRVRNAKTEAPSLHLGPEGRQGSGGRAGKAQGVVSRLWLWSVKRRPLKPEGTQMADKHVTRCSTSYVIREMQNQVAPRKHYTPIRMANIQNTGNTK